MGRNYGGYGGWAPYVPVSQRRRQALQEAAALKKKGHTCEPVTIEGRAIATSFWGKAWCDNLEAYSDYANRLPRGRTYVRNGSVIDLRVETGRVTARVSGSEIYMVEITVQALPAAAWQAIVRECSGKVASLVELLQGRLSKAVMEVVTRPGTGLFPQPRQIGLSCSCPDSASMCKHVAAALYGVGARFDTQPQLLFQLRHVDPQELTQHVGALPVSAPGAKDALAGGDLSALFGIDLADAPLAVAAPQGKARAVKADEAPAKKATPKAAPAAGPAATPRKARSRTVTAAELLARGVARHMIQAWLADAVLLRTEQRGVYRTTAQTEARIQAYVGRGSGAAAGPAGIEAGGKARGAHRS